MMGVSTVFLLLCAGTYLFATRTGKFVVWDELLASLNLRGDERILDVGCGRGAVLLLAAQRLRSGLATGLDLWQAQRSVWWRQLLSTLTWRRLSPWRSFTQPVYQLEGLPMGPRGQRLRVVRGEYRGPAAMVSFAFGVVETLLIVGVISLVFWLAPTENDTAQLWQSMAGEAGIWDIAAPLCYGLVVLFLEPFYVAAGFTLYLTRRSELEAWDIEQELRRAFQG